MTPEAKKYLHDRMAYCAKGACAVLAHGGPRHTAEATGWGDFLAEWIWCCDRLGIPIP